MTHEELHSTNCAYSKPTMKCTTSRSCRRKNHMITSTHVENSYDHIQHSFVTQKFSKLGTRDMPYLIGYLLQHLGPGVVVHTCNPNSQEAEAGRSRVGGHPRLHKKTLSQITNKDPANTIYILKMTK
jgi:hypothetical protein